jgi:hypothetical protein
MSSIEKRKNDDEGESAGTGDGGEKIGKEDMVLLLRSVPLAIDHHHHHILIDLSTRVLSH